MPLELLPSLLLCGSLLRPFVARHHKAVCIVMALALVAGAVMIII